MRICRGLQNFSSILYMYIYKIDNNCHIQIKDKIKKDEIISVFQNTPNIRDNLIYRRQNIWYKKIGIRISVR